MKPDRLAALERAGVIPRLSEAQRELLSVVVECLLDCDDGHWTHANQVRTWGWSADTPWSELILPDGSAEVARSLGKLLKEWCS